MEIHVRRIAATTEATIGLLTIDGVPFCWVLEDQKQAEKVYSETRIPAGQYQLKPRETGGFYARYKQRYPRHRGMIEISDVPN